ILEVFAEVKFSRRCKTVLPAAHINEIAVHGQDLLLGVVTFDLNSEHRLLNLSAEGSLRRQEEVLTQLLRQCASAFDHSASHEIFHPGARHAEKIDAPVRVEVLVFNRGDRIFDDLWNLIPRDDNPALEGEGSDHLAVVGIELGNEAGMIVVQGTYLR